MSRQAGHNADDQATGGGDPTIAALAAEAADQHTAWNQTAAFYAAETAVRRARQDERIAQQRAAYRRVAAARGQLTRAGLDGLGELLDRTREADAAVLDALEDGHRQESRRRHHNQNDHQNEHPHNLDDGAAQ